MVSHGSCNSSAFQAGFKFLTKVTHFNEWEKMLSDYRWSRSYNDYPPTTEITWECESLNIGKPGNSNFKSPYSPYFANFSKEFSEYEWKAHIKSGPLTLLSAFAHGVGVVDFSCQIYFSHHQNLVLYIGFKVYLSISTGFKDQILDKITFGQLSIKNKEPTSLSHLNFFDIKRKIFELRKLTLSTQKPLNIKR